MGPESHSDGCLFPPVVLKARNHEWNRHTRVFCIRLRARDHLRADIAASDAISALGERNRMPARPARAIEHRLDVVPHEHRFEERQFDREAALPIGHHVERFRESVIEFSFG